MEGAADGFMGDGPPRPAGCRCSAGASCSPPEACQRRGKSRADGRRSPHYSLVTAVPELRNDGIILNAHNDSEVAAHVAGEDEETARRFGWWPRTRRRRQSGPPTRTGPRTGRKTARCGRSRPVTRDRVPSSATASCASALTAPGKCRTGPCREARPGVCAQRPGPARRIRGLDRRHPPGSARRPRQPRLTARRRSRRLHPGGHLHRRRRNRIHPLHAMPPVTGQPPSRN